MVKHNDSDCAALAHRDVQVSTDPELEAEVRDVVGHYLQPLAKAVVLRVDERSQIQALDRPRPSWFPNSLLEVYSSSDSSSRFSRLASI